MSLHCKPLTQQSVHASLAVDKGLRAAETIADNAAFLLGASHQGNLACRPFDHFPVPAARTPPLIALPCLGPPCSPAYCRFWLPLCINRFTSNCARCRKCVPALLAGNQNWKNQAWFLHGRPLSYLLQPWVWVGRRGFTFCFQSTKAFYRRCGWCLPGQDEHDFFCHTTAHWLLWDHAWYRRKKIPSPISTCFIYGGLDLSRQQLPHACHAKTNCARYCCWSFGRPCRCVFLEYKIFNLSLNTTYFYW